MKGLKENILFVIALCIITILIHFLVGLLKIRGRFKERDLEKFPRQKNTIVFTNHPDGGEWFFIYRRFLKLRYLLFPLLFLYKTPYVVADQTNFDKPIIRIIKERIIRIDRNPTGTQSRASSFRKCISLLEKGRGIIGFFEGCRTYNAKEQFYSEKKNLPIGKINRSLGLLAKQPKVKVKIGGINFDNKVITSLKDDGSFSVSRLIRWYKETLFGNNGGISLVWGELKEFNGSPEEITQEVENYTLKLMDMT